MSRGMGGCLGHKVWDDTVCVCDGEVECPVCSHQLCRGLLVLLWRCWGGGCGCGGLMAQWVGTRSALGDAGSRLRQSRVGPQPSAQRPLALAGSGFPTGVRRPPLEAVARQVLTRPSAAVWRAHFRISVRDAGVNWHEAHRAAARPQVEKETWAWNKKTATCYLLKQIPAASRPYKWRKGNTDASTSHQRRGTAEQ